MATTNPADGGDMRKRDGIGGCAVLLVLIAMIALVTGALVYGFMIVTDYLPRH